MTSVIARNKKRDPSIDILKGVLITLLIVHHVHDFGHRSMGIDSTALDFIQLVQRPLILCYFMQTFFLITGMCSNYDKPVKTFIINQVKLLVVPAAVFSFIWEMTSGIDNVKHSALHVLKGGSYWFLTAMFFAKIIYYVLHKKITNNKIIFGILIVLSFCGTLLNELDLFKNYYWHRQIFDLSIFIAIGNIFKCKLINTEMGLICFCIYVVVCALCYAIYGAEIPYVTGGFGTSIDGWLFHLILATCGSIAVLNACKSIKSSKLLEYAGKQSLVIYVFHGLFLSYFLKAFAPLLSKGGGVSFFYAVIIITSVLGNCLFVAYVFDNTKLKVFFGKHLYAYSP